MKIKPYYILLGMILFFVSMFAFTQIGHLLSAASDSQVFWGVGLLIVVFFMFYLIIRKTINTK